MGSVKVSSNFKFIIYFHNTKIELLGTDNINNLIRINALRNKISY